MHCVKLLGQSLMARDFDRQVAEIQIRVAALNKYTALGIPVTEVIGSFRPEKGEVPSRPDLYNKASFWLRAVCSFWFFHRSKDHLAFVSLVNQALRVWELKFS